MSWEIVNTGERKIQKGYITTIHSAVLCDYCWIHGNYCTSSWVFWAVVSAPLGVYSRVWTAVSACVFCTSALVSLTAVERACNIMAGKRLPLSNEKQVIVTIGYLSLLLRRTLQRPECGQRPEWMTGQFVFMGLWVPVVWVFCAECAVTKWLCQS